MLVRQAQIQSNVNIRCTSEHNNSIAEKMCMDRRKHASVLGMRTYLGDIYVKKNKIH